MRELQVFKKNVSKYSSCVFARIFFRMILDMSYVMVISKYWSYYMNLTLNISGFRVLISYFLTLLLALITPQIKVNLSSFFLNVQFYIVLVPMCSLYGLSGRSLTFLVGLVVCHVMQCFLLSAKFNVLWKKRICLIRSKEILLFFLGIILIGIVFSLIQRGAIPDKRVFNLSLVYDVRKAAVPLSGIMRYLVPWAVKVILPFLLVHFLSRKKFMHALLIVLVQIYFYSVFAQKSFLFTPFLAAGVFYCIKWNGLRIGLEHGLSGLVLTTTLIVWINETWIMPISLLVRRVLYLPATIKFAYYDFFSKHLKVHFADGTLGAILGLQSPYEKEIPKIISEYLGRPDSNCNAGYWADAFANGGWVGVLMLSVLLVIFIKLLEHFGRKMDPSVLIASSAYLLYSLNDAALLTTLLTGGGLLLLLIYIVNSMSYSYEKKV